MGFLLLDACGQCASHFDRCHPTALYTSAHKFQISNPVNGSLAIGGRSNVIVIGRWMPMVSFHGGWMYMVNVFLVVTVSIHMMCLP